MVIKKVFEESAIPLCININNNEQVIYAIGIKYFILFKLIPKIEVTNFKYLQLNMMENSEQNFKSKQKINFKDLPEEAHENYFKYINSVPLSKKFYLELEKYSKEKVDIISIQTHGPTMIITTDKLLGPKLKKLIQKRLSEIEQKQIEIISKYGAVRVSNINKGKKFIH